MKPKRLEFCGINSFSEKAVIDFDKLLASGIFGIFGDTGSGKTTILDSMIFALYGKVDRIRGGNASEIINYHCEKAYVIFDFECEWEGKRRLFRVNREIKRKNSQQNLELCEIVDGAVRAVSDGVKKTNEKILEIIGLSFEDFKKCIALPQGEFAQFVKVERGERLKLIARLFDLDLYGDKLNGVLRGRFDAVKLALAEKDGRLNEYAEYSEEGKKALEADYVQLCTQKEALDREYEVQRAAFEKLKTEYERAKKLSQQRAVLAREHADRAVMEDKKAALQRMPFALAATRAEEKAKRAEDGYSAASAAAERAAADFSEKSQKLKESEERSNKEDYDNALADIRAKKAIFKTADADLKELADQKRERESLAAEYKAASVAKLTAERELSALEREIESLRDKESNLAGLSPEEYLRSHFESALLQSEFAANHRYFDEKLQALRENYSHEGVLYADIERELIARTAYYRQLEENEKFADASALLERFRGMQAEQKALSERLHQAELKREKWIASKSETENNLNRAAGEGIKVKQKIDLLTEKLSGLLGKGAEFSVADVKQLETQEAALLASRDRVRKEQEQLRRQIGEAEVAHARAQERQVAMQKEKMSAADEISAALKDGGFVDLSEAKTLLSNYPNSDALAKEIESYESRVRSIEASIHALTEEGEPADIDDDVFQLHAREFAALTDKKEKIGRECAVFRNNIDRFNERLNIKKSLEKERSAISRQYDQIEKLRKLFYGNAFMEFVAGEYLADISSAATETLLRLTNGRYFIRYEQGFYVGDNFNAGTLRSVNTLSGGETFLVSLSLALSLSAAIYAKSLRPIEFFFLDEGFGTLDEKLIDTVMDSLEKLKNTHFSIGLISHVEELKHRIDNKITVISAQEGESSKIKISC